MPIIADYLITIGKLKKFLAKQKVKLDIVLRNKLGDVATNLFSKILTASAGKRGENTFFY